MKTSSLLIAVALIGNSASWGRAQDPLSSWNDTAAKHAIIAFVARVTHAGSEDFVAPAQRIAVFDNDGTLCCEAPMPIQAAYALDEVKRLARMDPSLNSDPMVSAALNGDIGKLMEGNHHDGLMRIMALTHTGMTTDEFRSRVKEWLAGAKDPKFGKAFTI